MLLSSLKKILENFGIADRVYFQAIELLAIARKRNVRKNTVIVLLWEQFALKNAIV